MLSVKSFVFNVEQFLTNISSLKDEGYIISLSHSQTRDNTRLYKSGGGWLRDVDMEYVHIS